ncbi:MAG TPA: sensor histidine kinase [Nostocaceae cyanobacterium]|nr:sensor histidine kinase [Nostocaceae cyanobacterium]
MWITLQGSFSNAGTLLNKSLLTNILFISIAFVHFLMFSSYCLFWDQWLQIFVGMILWLSHSILLIGLYQNYQYLELSIQKYHTVIDIIFETIHNGPLQNLANILRLLKRQDLPTNRLLPQIEQELEKTNLDLRGIYEFYQHRNSIQSENLYLGNNLVINLKEPLHNILYQVYSHTLERDFPCFKTIKAKICTFDPIDEQGLSIAHKRGICRFLEESLCNVGKYAVGVTYLQVICSASSGWQTLSIIDDGLGVNSSQEGWGTKHFNNLARQLKGKFRRSHRFPRGTICELSWPLKNFYQSITVKSLLP